MFEPFEVDGHRFTFSGHDGSWELMKPPAHLERFRRLVDGIEGANVVELGIHRGGSTAYAAVAGRPRRWLAVDIGDPVPALEKLAADLGCLRPRWGVDQADRQRLAQLVADEIGGPLDVVYDDASHVLAPTIASFEALFPLLRPGGRYIIEDWDWELAYAAAYERLDAAGRAGAVVASRPHDSPGHTVACALGLDGFPPPADGWKPLAAILADLTAAHLAHPDAISRVILDGPWLVVERGPAELAAPCSLDVLGGLARRLLC